MSRRRSTRLQGRNSETNEQDPVGKATFDERLGFLRDDDTERPLRRRFEHRIPGATGPVEVVYWPAKGKSSSAPEQLTLFILGNPGLIDYYLPFLTHLHSLLPDSHAILCTSHIGHEPHLPAPERPAELHTLLATKIELVTALRASLDAWASKGDDRTKLVLIGHSLGGWLVCETMKRLPEAVHAGYLLFPSLGWMAQSWNGRTMWPLFTPLVINTLPTISYLLRPILPLTTFPTTTLALLRSPTTIYHALQLARSELQSILAPDVEWIRHQAARSPAAGTGLFGIWSAGSLDGWVGKDGPLVQEALGGEEGGRVRLLDKVPHAFCLTQKNSELVASIVAGWMAPDASVKKMPDRIDGEHVALDSIAPM